MVEFILKADRTKKEPLSCMERSEVGRGLDSMCVVVIEAVVTIRERLGFVRCGS